MSQTPNAPPARLCLAVALVAGAMLLLEVMLTRLFSVAFFHHYSFFAVSLIMTGLALGGIAVSRWNVRASSADKFSNRLGLLAWLFSASTVIASVHLVVTSTPNARLTLTGVALQAVVFLPGLIAAGAYLGAAFARRADWIHSLYAADLLAAATACLAAIFLMRTVQGPAMLLAPATLAAAAAALTTTRPLHRAAYLVTTAAVAGAVVLATVSGGDFMRLAGDDYVFERWNEHSRVVVRDLPSTDDHHLIVIDRSAETPLRRLSADQVNGRVPIEPDWRASARYIAYLLGRPMNRVAVIGVGGGDDTLAPMALGIEHIDGYELNKIMIDLLRSDFQHLNALATRPELDLIHSEARVGILHSGKKYDLIQASLIDTWAATAGGGFLLSENGLYTTEGWAIFLDALTDDGLLTMTRWYLSSAPAETQRLVALASTALERMGTERPANHVLVVAQELPGILRLPSEGTVQHATIVISKAPFSEQEVGRFFDQVEQRGFLALAAPGVSGDPVIQRLLDNDQRQAAIDDSPFDISPPSDERPYFFLQIRPGNVLTLSERSYGPITEITLNGIRVLVLLSVLALLFSALVLVLATLTLPSASPSREDRVTYLWMTLYFFGIGMGYILIQLGLHQRLILILGHPTLVLSVVLFWMLLGTGSGAYLSSRLFPEGRYDRAWLLIVGTLALLVVSFSTLQTLETLNSGLSRALASGLLLAAIGFVLGFAFPIGIAIVGRTGEWAVQKMWAVNGAASIAASAVSALTGLSFGSRAVVLAGTLCYVAAAIAGAAALRARNRSTD